MELAMPAGKSWAPNAAGTANILQLLRDSQTVDNSQHQLIYRKLEELRNHPEFNNYLAYVMASCKNESDELRGRAGLMLKNNVRDNYENMHPIVREFIKNQALSCVGDSVPFIRHTAGTLVSTIAVKGKMSGWPMLWKHLVQLLQSQNMTEVDGALDAVSKICEEAPEQLSDECNGERPLDAVLPVLIHFFSHSEESFRARALTTCNHFVVSMPAALVRNMEPFLSALFSLTQDGSPRVRKEVCHALCLFLEASVESIAPAMRQIIEFMIGATKEPDELVSLEACEFWTIYCSAQSADLTLLQEYLPVLLPVLLDGMVYSATDMMLLTSEEDDNENVPDRPEDIKPRFHTSRHHGAANNDSDESDTEDWDDDDDVGEWNLRKCSASGLDKLSMTYKDSILPILFPILQERLSNLQNWKIRESAILALGAIAEGCFAGLEPHLNDLVPYLIKLLLDPKSLIRSITCWTLSRFSKWVLAQPNDDTVFKPLMQALLGRVLDTNKKVQEAACSAFATLEEEAGERLVPYLGPILENLMFAFQKYQVKNKLILYDAIGTLAEAVGPHLAKPEFVQLLMTNLISEFTSMRNDDRNIFPLLECLTYIAQALGPVFLPYAQSTYTRCLSIIEQTLHAQRLAEQASSTGMEAVFPDKEFVVCALDLLSGLAEGLESMMESLLPTGNLYPMLYACTTDVQADVRQSAIALVGDLAKNAPGHLLPHLDLFVGSAIKNLDYHEVAVCNNASWALGEIAVMVGDRLKPYVQDIMTRIVPLLNAHGLESRLLENLSITIGRVGNVCPDDVAPFLDQFLRPWCFYLSRYQEDAEKVHAFEGVCLVCRANPQAVLGLFPELCLGIAAWRSPPTKLRNMFAQLLHGFKASLTPQNQWQEVFGRCQDSVKAHLVQMYGV